ncbi:hypothetical protein Bca101_070157 [Brassica carinata]
MAWRKTTTVKRRSCGEGGAEAEVEARQTRLGQALCWLHLLTTITDLRSSSDETGKRSSERRCEIRLGRGGGLKLGD